MHAKKLFDETYKRCRCLLSHPSVDGEQLQRKKIHCCNRVNEGIANMVNYIFKTSKGPVIFFTIYWLFLFLTHF